MVFGGFLVIIKQPNSIYINDYINDSAMLLFKNLTLSFQLQHYDIMAYFLGQSVYDKNANAVK